MYWHALMWGANWEAEAVLPHAKNYKYKRIQIFIQTCISLAGFKSISKRTSLDAPIRFNPTPPALELNRNTTVPQKRKRTSESTLSLWGQCITEKLSHWKAWRQCVQKPFSTFIRLLVRIGTRLGRSVHTGLLRSGSRTNTRLTVREKNGWQQSNLYGSGHIYIFLCLFVFHAYTWI